MPKYEQTFSIAGMDTEDALSVCWSCFRQLGWQPVSVTENKLSAFAPTSWKSKNRIIVAAITGEDLTISSEMSGDELYEISGKNKKNVESFIETFQNTKSIVPVTEKKQNTDAINSLREQTTRVDEEQQAEITELQKALNLNENNLNVTIVIIGLNVIVFFLMAVAGAGIFIPNGFVHIKWGSDFAPLTLSGEWWRLITSMFIHFGIIHLALNMFCLFNIGLYLEPFIGKKRFIAAYISTGIMGGIASLWWHTTPVNSAGASGAIFGLYGVFLAFLTTNIIPKKSRTALLQSIGLFIFFNLVYGLKGTVDSAGHIGGLLSGVVIGYLLVPVIKKEKQEDRPVLWSAPAIVLITAAITFLYLQQNKRQPEEMLQKTNAINDAKYKQTQKFNYSYQDFLQFEKIGLSVFTDPGISEKQRLSDLKEIASVEWQSAAELAAEMEKYDVDEALKQKAVLMASYAQLRQKEIDIIEEAGSFSPSNTRLIEIRKEITALENKIK